MPPGGNYDAMPLALLRPQVTPRTWIRGESYFADGAVRELDVRGSRASALVAGSAEEDYEVELRWTRDDIEGTCTCPYEYGGPCKHQLAVAFALARPAKPSALDRGPSSAVQQPSPAKPAAVPPRPASDAIDDARRHEIETREQSATDERIRIERRLRGPIDAFVVHSRESDARYEVLRVADDFWWCACADHRTSELPICKHIVRVLELRGPARRPCALPVAVLSAHDTRGVVHEPLADVRVYLPASLRGGLGSLLDARGFVRPEKLGAKAPEKLRAKLAGVPGMIVRPEVDALLASLESRAERAKRHATFERRVRSSEANGTAPPPEWRALSSSLRLPPHPYQIDGILFALRAERALLGDDMGLGKTYQSLAQTRLLCELGEVRRALVICPASVKHQWAREAAKLLGDSLSVHVVEGPRKAREPVYRNNAATLFVLGYELLWTDLPLVRALAPDLVILDEAQRIKNWNTRTAKCVKALSSPRTLVLTGTPLENRLAELHSIAEHLDPRALGPMWRMASEHTEQVETESGRRQLVGFRNLELLRKRLAPRFLRRERAAVLDQLPPRTDQSFAVDLTSEQAAVHAEHYRKAVRILRKRWLTQADTLALMAELTQMRLIANGLLLYHWDETEPHVRRGALPAALLSRYPSPKLAELSSVLEQLLATHGTRVVVFSQWERMLRLAALAVAPVLTAAGVKPVFFHGKLSSRERAEVVSDFHEDPETRVLFSTDAGGLGLNLQEAASAVVHLELPWNPALFEQRVGRIHRMGQRKPIQVLTLATANSIEAKIAMALQSKRALFDGLFRGDEDEIRFDDETRGGFAERMRALLGINEGDAAPTELPSSSLAEVARPIDEPVRVAPAGVADLTPIAPAAAPAATPAEPVSPDPTRQSLELDLTRVLGAFGMPIDPNAANPARPLKLTRAEGRVTIELDDVSETAWTHLRSFIEALGRGR